MELKLASFEEEEERVGGSLSSLRLSCRPFLRILIITIITTIILIIITIVSIFNIFREVLVLTLSILITL